MQLQDLGTFVTVASERSFSVAAKKLHRTQPAVSQAIREDRVLEIDYWTESRGAITKRLIESHLLVNAQDAWYVVAYCRRAEAQRTFRLDRIRSAVLLDEHENMVPPSARLVPIESARLPQVDDVVGAESDEHVIVTDSAEERVLDDEKERRPAAQARKKVTK